MRFSLPGLSSVVGGNGFSVSQPQPFIPMATPAQMKKNWVRTKIVCTIGPASGSVKVIQGLISSGMSVARLNLAHGSLQDHQHHIQVLRALATKVASPLALLLDLPGPKYRTGKLKMGEAELRRGTRFVLTTTEGVGDEGGVSVNLPTLPEDVQVGDHILLSDGEINMVVEEISGKEVRCQVQVGGILKDNRGLVSPGRTPSSPYLTEQTLRQLDFALEQQVDYLALSFVRNAEDITQVRQRLEEKGVIIPLVSKIETSSAIANIADVLATSDAVMIARGDLGVELPLEQVPVLQKDITRKCRRLGKPVIVATQMLESMVQAPQPTRAEVADVANAVFDGADAVMLSGETSIGRYPEAATAMMARIAARAESTVPYEQQLAESATVLEPQTADAIAFAACHTAHQLRAAAVIAFTESGSTAFQVAKCRPRVPLLALTPRDMVRRRLALVWGVRAYLVDRPATVDDMFLRAAKLAKELKVVARGDLIVITAGVPIGVTGTTNLLKVHTVD